MPIAEEEGASANTTEVAFVCPIRETEDRGTKKL